MYTGIYYCGPSRCMAYTSPLYISLVYMFRYFAVSYVSDYWALQHSPYQTLSTTSSAWWGFGSHCKLLVLLYRCHVTMPITYNPPTITSLPPYTPPSVPPSIIWHHWPHSQQKSLCKFQIFPYCHPNNRCSMCMILLLLKDWLSFGAHHLFCFHSLTCSFQRHANCSEDFALHTDCYYSH